MTTQALFIDVDGTLAETEKLSTVGAVRPALREDRAELDRCRTV
jgi:hydroxymethylpyrimidine pyrophosphatase-like HAD family hydrolase